MTKKKINPITSFFDLKGCWAIVATLTTLMFLCLWLQKPRVVEIEKKIYVKADASITGATSASIAPNGAVIASGSNLSIRSTVTSKETNKTEFNFNSIYIDGLIKSDLNLGVGATYANRDFRISVGYYFVKPEYFASAGMSLITW